MTGTETCRAHTATVRQIRALIGESTPRQIRAATLRYCATHGDTIADMLGLMRMERDRLTAEAAACGPARRADAVMERTTLEALMDCLAPADAPQTAQRPTTVEVS